MVRLGGYEGPCQNFDWTGEVARHILLVQTLPNRVEQPTLVLQCGILPFEQLGVFKKAVKFFLAFLELRTQKLLIMFCPSQSMLQGHQTLFVTGAIDAGGYYCYSSSIPQSVAPLLVHLRLSPRFLQDWFS
jgi:hypothetical protein